VTERTEADERHAAEVRAWTRANPERAAEVYRALVGRCLATWRRNRDHPEER
jgi:hypothetical protein